MLLYCWTHRSSRIGSKNEWLYEIKCNCFQLQRSNTRNLEKCLGNQQRTEPSSCPFPVDRDLFLHSSIIPLHFLCCWQFTNIHSANRCVCQWDLPLLDYKRNTPHLMFKAMRYFPFKIRWNHKYFFRNIGRTLNCIFIEYKVWFDILYYFYN